MREDRFIEHVLSRIPPGLRRAQIEMDMRGHLAERVEHGQSIEEAIRQFGDPDVLAESYLSAVPLVSASFFERAAAKIVDLALVAAGSCAILWSSWKILGPPGVPFYPGITQTTQLLLVATCVVTFVLIVPSYFVLSEYVLGQTVGKYLMNIRAVRESGARISFGQALLRQLPYVAGIFFIDILFALFTEKNQRAFELISKTRVVRVEEEPA